MTPVEAEWRLEEWAVWARGGNLLEIGWPSAAAFAWAIKPDPSPSRLPVEPERAAQTDRVVAKLPPRRRFWVKMHYLDPAPVEAKARRVGRKKDAYRREIAAIVEFVARRLD